METSFSVISFTLSLTINTWEYETCVIQNYTLTVPIYPRTQHSNIGIGDSMSKPLVNSSHIYFARRNIRNPQFVPGVTAIV
jgi:hypothetical protein